MRIKTPDEIEYINSQKPATVKDVLKIMSQTGVQLVSIPSAKEIKEQIEKLPRYEMPYEYSDEMVESNNGMYLKVEDVFNLFKQW